MTKQHIYIFGQKIDGIKNESPRKQPKEAQQAPREEHREYEYGGYDWQHHYHHHHGSPAVGTIMVFAGAILVLNTFNVLPWIFWEQVKMFWPAIFIIIGVQLIFGHNWFSRAITFLITLAICAYITLYGLVQIESPFIQYLPAQTMQFYNSIQSLNQ